MNKGLTATFIFEAQSANYGEGVGNITALKKLSREGGDTYSYISRQALRYSIIETLGWSNTPCEAIGSGDKKVVQFAPGVTIENYPEVDLFGYMKTEKSKGALTRSAVVRLSNAVALEPYNSDMDFLTNMGMAKRANADNAIAQSEIHKSFYSYTITIDLDRVGEDGEIKIPTQEKIKRVNALLSAIENLYRDIKGRRENLSPSFAIGGIYDKKCPFFENRIRINKQFLNIDMILETMKPICNDTLVGYVSGTFRNDNKIKEDLKPMTIYDMFDELRRRVEVVYNESN